VAHLQESGYQVMGISRAEEPNRVFLPYKWNAQRKLLFNPLDINHDLMEIMQLVDTFKPDYVVNFAAQSMVAQSWLHPEHWFQTNVVATIKLHDELRQRNFLKKYVHISTPEVYGSCEGLIQENNDYNPSTPYAVSRAAADMSLMSFFHAYKFPVVFTRAANVFGPGQQLYRIIPRTVLYFLTGKKLQLQGGGQSIRSFIHIRDVAEATLRAALSGVPGEIYHLSTTRNISIHDLVKLIAERMSVSFNEYVEEVGDRLGKDSAYLLDSSKAKTELDWSAEISLEDGIDEVIQWVSGNLETMQHLPQNYIHKP